MLRIRRNKIYSFQVDNEVGLARPRKAKATVASQGQGLASLLVSCSERLKQKFEEKNVKNRR